MALVWLDAARYADSGGYQNDMRRSPVALEGLGHRAYNANIPFDQFTIEQLAGDLLPNPTREQRLATPLIEITGSITRVESCRTSS